MNCFKNVILVFFVLLTYQGFSQNNVVEDFKKLNEHYLNLNKYCLKFELTYIDKNNQQLMQQKGEVVHSKNLHMSSFGSNITLMHKDEVIAINKRNKLIIYTKVVNKNKPNSEKNLEDVSSLIDSLSVNYSHLKYNYLKGKKNEKKIFIEDASNKDYDGYMVIVDSKNYRLKELTYYLKDKPNSKLSQVKIRYTDENPKPNLNRDDLKFKYYLEGKPGKFSAASRFNGYKVVDQTENQQYYGE